MPVRPIACLALALLLGGWVSACDRRQPQGPAGPAGSGPTGTDDQPVYAYTVRGQVESVPEPGNPGSGFEVHHEAIDNFVKPGGGLGMNAMTMEFPPGPGVSLDGISVGDIVEVTFEVRLKPRIRWHATRVVRLPPDTKLEFRAARPPPGP